MSLHRLGQEKREKCGLWSRKNVFNRRDVILDVLKAVHGYRAHAFSLHLTRGESPPWSHFPPLGCSSQLLLSLSFTSSNKKAEILPDPAPGPSSLNRFIWKNMWERKSKAKCQPTPDSVPAPLLGKPWLPDSLSTGLGQEPESSRCAWLQGLPRAAMALTE